MSELQDLFDKRQFLSSEKKIILDAIKKQRKFYFRNKPNIIFDRDNALLWSKNNFYLGYHVNPDNELSSINKNGVDGYKNWRLPTKAEFGKMIEPDFKHDAYYSSNRYYIAGDGIKSYYYLLPCSSQLQPKDYDTLTSDEKAQIVLDIFEKNELEPMFENHRINDLLSKYDVKNCAFKKALIKVQRQIDAEIKSQIISSKLDWAELKTKFDFGADSSPIRYAVSVKNLTTYLIEKFDDYIAEKFSVLDELQKFSAPRELIPNTYKVRADLKSFNEDAVRLYKYCTDISSLNELDDVPRPTFSLVTETLTEKIRREILKVELYETLPNFVNKVLAMFVDNYNDLPIDFITLNRTVREIILELTDYVFAGHLRQKIGEVAAAELVIENYRLYIDSLAKRYREKQNQTTQADIIGRLEAMQKNMMQVVEKLDDEFERIWLKKRMGRDRLLDF